MKQKTFVAHTPAFAHELAADLGRARGKALVLSDAGQAGMAKLHAELERMALGISGVPRLIADRFNMLVPYGVPVPEIIELRFAMVDDLPFTASSSAFGTAPPAIAPPPTPSFPVNSVQPEWRTTLLRHLGTRLPVEPDYRAYGTELAQLATENANAVAEIERPQMVEPETDRYGTTDPLAHRQPIDYYAYKRGVDGAVGEVLLERQEKKRDAKLADVARRMRSEHLGWSAKAGTLVGGLDHWLRRAIAAIPSSYGKFAARMLTAENAGSMLSRAISPDEALELLLASLDDRAHAMTFEPRAVEEPLVELEVRIRAGTNIERRRRGGEDFTGKQYRMVKVPRSQAERILNDDALDAFVIGDTARQLELQAAHDRQLAQLQRRQEELERKLEEARATKTKREAERRDREERTTGKKKG